ncbi:MAG TPA: hypothetical protein VFP06_08505 [Acidimicrobiales bacterium]|nr:hypothetical protein [Acidimicrobiales bacterium]
MLGAVLIVVVLVVVIPVAVMMSGAVVAAALGWALRDDAEARYQGSELIALNR